MLFRSIGLVPFCPLGRGFLAGNVRRAEECTAKDHRQYDPRFHGENFDANRNAVEIVRNIAEAIGAKPSQVALAWLLGKGDFIVRFRVRNAVSTLRRMPPAWISNSATTTWLAWRPHYALKPCPDRATTKRSWRGLIADLKEPNRLK